MKKADRILEAKDLQLYRRLLQVLGDYSKNVPCTGVDRLFDVAVEQGAKIMPKDKMAATILGCHIFGQGTTASIIQKLLNMRFSDLPIEYRPIIKSGRRHLVANWTRGNQVSDRVKDLVDWQGTGKEGNWTDIDGNKLEIIRLEDER